jgi:hypothetical protein
VVGQEEGHGDDHDQGGGREGEERGGRGDGQHEEGTEDGQAQGRGTAGGADGEQRQHDDVCRHRDGHGEGREGRGDGCVMSKGLDGDLKAGADGGDRGEDQVMREGPDERPTQRLADLLGGLVLEV